MNRSRDYAAETFEGECAAGRTADASQGQSACPSFLACALVRPFADKGDTVTPTLKMMKTSSRLQRANGGAQ